TPRLTPSADEKRRSPLRDDSGLDLADLAVPGGAQPPCRSVPAPDLVVAAVGDQPASVRCVEDADRFPLLVRVDGQDRNAAGGDLPDTNLAVVPAGCDPRAIRRKRESVQLRPGGADYASGLPRNGVAESDRAVLPAGGERGSIGGINGRIDIALVIGHDE